MGVSQARSGVSYKELDFSTVISQASTSIAVLMGASSKGRLGLFGVTAMDQFTAEYGNPNASISFFHYAATAFYQKGGTQLVCNRVAGTGYGSGGVILQQLTGDTTPQLRGISFTGDSSSVALATAFSATAATQNIILFYPISGPGSWSSTMQIQISSNNMAAPVLATPAVLAAQVGSTLLASTTYSYAIVAVNNTCSSVASSVQTATTVSAGSGVSLTWTPVPNATSYVIYGRVGASMGIIATVGGGTFTYMDLGLTTSVTKTPPSVAVTTNDFTVLVYDTAKQATALETFLVSFDNKLGSDGLQMNFLQKIPALSNYIQVVSNMSNILTTPTLFNQGPVSFGSGSSGSAVTDSNIALAWAQVQNPSRLSVNMFINGGYSTPTVQLAMDNIAQLRGDSIAILDMPSASQLAVQSALDYRNLTLNLNSNRSAIYTPDVLFADNVNGQSLYIPPSGFIAGTFAYTDYVAWPWFQPAGLQRGLLDVLGVRAIYQEGEMENLAAAQINYIRNIPGMGISIWEGRTLQSNQSARSWISVRRLLDVLRTSISKFCLYYLQEPNDDITVRSILGPINQYLSFVQSNRGISNFKVISDTTNNGPEIANAGQRNVDIYIQPILPIGVIQLTSLLSAQGDAAFKELLLSNTQL